jgi:hypothetical protein
MIMAKISKTRAAQYPLVQEYVFNFADSVVDVNGVTKSFAAQADDPVFPMFDMPQGAVVLGGDVLVEEAYVGPTAATLSVGPAGSATKYANAVDVKTAARTALTIPAAGVSGEEILGTLAMTVADATAGKVRVRIMYTIDGRGQEVA